METTFRKFGKITLSSIIFLIFVGGFVRATGSGMGCPDWPKCFGTWIPPTNVNQLPVNYQEIFGAKLKGEVIFNPIKTWIEYLNRLVGVMVGIFTFITFVLAYRAYWPNRKSIVWLTGLVWILVGIEGGLGAKVVSTELHPLMITLHMLLSVVILSLLILVLLKTGAKKAPILNASRVSFLLVIAIIFSIGQIILGTQLREAVDIAQKLLGDDNRANWLENSQGKVGFHAGLALIILALNFVIFNKLKVTSIKNWATLLLVLTLVSLTSGFLLGFMGLPAFSQPIHLVIAIGIISVQFVLYFYLKPSLLKN